MDRRLVRKAMEEEDLEFIGRIHNSACSDEPDYGAFFYCMEDNIIIFDIGEDDGHISEIRKPADAIKLIEDVINDARGSLMGNEGPVDDIELIRTAKKVQSAIIDRFEFDI